MSVAVSFTALLVIFIFLCVFFLFFILSSFLKKKNEIQIFLSHKTSIQNAKVVPIFPSFFFFFLEFCEKYQFFFFFFFFSFIFTKTITTTSCYSFCSNRIEARDSKNTRIGYSTTTTTTTKKKKKRDDLLHSRHT